MAERAEEIESCRLGQQMCYFACTNQYASLGVSIALNAMRYSLDSSVINYFIINRRWYRKCNRNFARRCGLSKVRKTASQTASNIAGPKLNLD